MKLGIPDRQHLVNDQNLRFQVGGDGEGEANLHATAVVLHGRINKLFYSREGYDLVKLSLYLAAFHAQDRSIEIDVLAARQLGMEAGAYLQQRGYPTKHLKPPRGGFGNAGEDFEQRALARPVAANDAYGFAAFDLEVDVL